MTRRSIADETIKEAAEEQHEQSYIEDQVAPQKSDRQVITSHG